MGKPRVIILVFQSLYLQMDLESLLEHDLTMQVIVMQIMIEVMYVFLSTK